LANRKRDHVAIGDLNDELVGERLGQAIQQRVLAASVAPDRSAGVATPVVGDEPTQELVILERIAEDLRHHRGVLPCSASLKAGVNCREHTGCLSVIPENGFPR
jgi:hypothetical protein